MINVFTFSGKTTNIGETIVASNVEVYQHQNIGSLLGVLPEHKDYEEKAVEFKFEFTGEENLFIVDPSEEASGALLVVLEAVKDSRNYIICLHPDKDFLSKKQAQQTKLVIMILQEFARSGLITELILLDERIMENGLEEIEIGDYEEKLQEFISGIVSTLWWAKNNEGIMNKLIEPLETTRITTLGAYNWSDDNINMFFELEYLEKEARFPLEIDFYFIVSQKTLKENKKLVKQIKNIILNKKQQQFHGANIGFKILEGSGDYTLTQIKTSKIQTI